MVAQAADGRVVGVLVENSVGLPPPPAPAAALPGGPAGKGVMKAQLILKFPAGDPLGAGAGAQQGPAGGQLAALPPRLAAPDDDPSTVDAVLAGVGLRRVAIPRPDHVEQLLTSVLWEGEEVRLAAFCHGHALLCSAVLCSAVLCSAVLCSAVLFPFMQPGLVRVG